MPTLADQRRLIDALQKMHAARVIETHISWVLLIGEYAYKIKKAVDLGFINYLSLSSRENFCAEELRLNRRTAPDLYLEVVNIGGSVDAPQFGVQPAIEYAVKMRRFADDVLMDTRVQKGSVDPSHIDSLAGIVARFHEQAAALDTHSSFATAGTIRAVAIQNFEQMRTLLKDDNDLQQLATLEQKTGEEWQACVALFELRRREGRVRECHGDLHLGNIALIDEEPVPFDCIEFSPELRWIDVMDEVAFTMMDLLHHGRSDFAWRYLNAYLEASGDYEGVGVLRFYLAYRAAVRAKISAIRTSQSGISSEARDQHLQACRAHLALAQLCLSDGRPALIITHGLPGSGKTTFAQYALEQLGAVRIRSDVERKRIFGLSALEGSSKLHVDIYSKEATSRTYGRLLALARTLLTAGYPVVVDAAFLKIEERQQFRALAQEIASPFVIATLDADESILRDRIESRRHDASEADVNVFEKLQAVQQKLSATEMKVNLRFNTSKPPQSAGNAHSWIGLLKHVYKI
jgi:aminoglycoside phosphotransferase family enzyme/predicted kinase